MNDRIEIIEIGLDKNLKEEIMKPAHEADDSIRVEIKGHLAGLRKQSINKKAQKAKKWEGKLDIVFGILKESYDKDPQAFVAKHVIMEALKIEDKELSPTIQKFIKFLRTTKEDKWTMIKKRVKGVTSYALAPFA
jgi:hypothetical protein